MQAYFSDVLRRNISEAEVQVFQELADKLEANLASFSKRGEAE